MKIKIIALILVIFAGFIIYEVRNNTSQTLKIGVISPLSGDSAYWGESTLVGLKLAEAELVKNSIPVSFVVEDGQLDPKIALNAAQKLVDVDGVSVIYSEFNPASIVVSSFLKGKDVFHLYDSAAISPLSSGPYNFKTYLDYEKSCQETAQYVKDVRGVKKVGVLKLNLEVGALCLKGIQSVFGENTFAEIYNFAETDFRIALKKIERENVGAIFNVSFETETLASIKQMRELGINTLFVGLSEIFTPKIAAEYSVLIEGDVFLGLPPINPSLEEKIRQANGGKDVANYNAAAFAYIHLTQLGNALYTCDADMECMSEFMKSVPGVQEIGFDGFENKIAKFKTSIIERRNGKFIKKK